MLSFTMDDIIYNGGHGSLSTVIKSLAHITHTSNHQEPQKYMKRNTFPNTQDARNGAHGEIHSIFLLLALIWKCIDEADCDETTDNQRPIIVHINVTASRTYNTFVFMICYYHIAK